MNWKRLFRCWLWAVAIAIAVVIWADLLVSAYNWIGHASEPARVVLMAVAVTGSVAIITYLSPLDL